MTRRWGATPEEWAAFTALAPGDVWPCVNNPAVLKGKTKTDPGGPQDGAELSKVPSSIAQGDRLAYRIPGYTKSHSTPRQYAQWRSEPDLGLGIMCRAIKAIDIDIDDKEHAAEIDEFIADYLDATLPARQRYASGRMMLLCRINAEGIRPKRVVHTAHGVIEFLGDRQFAALAGVHKSGYRNVWPDGIPASLDEIPEFDDFVIDGLIDALIENYGVDDRPTGNKTQLIVPEERHAEDADDESVKRMIVQLGDSFLGMLPDGKMAVRCPWQHEHVSTGGKPDVTLDKTVLFPPGVGGFTRWGFKCVHDAGHGPKTFAQFAENLGLLDGSFDPAGDATAVDLSRPPFTGVSRNGDVPATPHNMLMAMGWAGLGVRLMYDGFFGEILIAYDDSKKYRAVRDTDYFEIQVRLQTACNIIRASTTNVREAVAYVAESNGRDTAIEWAGGLVWDGKDRLSRLHADVLGCEDTPYAAAVVRYMFTALAGRCLTPGIKADMAPVLIGPQGCRKTTFIQRLAPLPESYLSINLALRDDDMSRLLRGRLVVESGELRGYSLRAEDSLKEWMTRTKESWVPKYKEQPKDFPRRFLLIGSTNDKRFLVDHTGSRRWLPLEVCKTRKHIDTDFISGNLSQLWAQAIHEFTKSGIAYEMAELLGRTQAEKYTRISSREAAIKRWLATRTGDGFATTDIASGAMGLSASSLSVLVDIERVLMRLGYTQDDAGFWHLDFL